MTLNAKLYDKYLHLLVNLFIDLAPTLFAEEQGSKLKDKNIVVMNFFFLSFLKEK